MFYCFLLIVGAENANNFWCCGKVTNVYVDNNKNLNLKGSWRNDDLPPEFAVTMK